MNKPFASHLTGLFCTTGAGALAAALLTSPAAAQSASSAVQSTGEIVVTAQKRAENIQDVPLSIMALSGKSLAATGVNDVVGLQKDVPNLRIDSIAQAAGVTLRIRGMGASSNAAIDPSVAPYIDGVYIPRPGAMLTSFLDVEDVEVLRGPQGTLFGRNATVGAIALRTVDPSVRGDSGEVSGEVGDYGERKAQGIGNLALGDHFAARAAAYLSHTDGFIHDTASGQQLGRGDTGAGRLSFKAELTPSLTWKGRVDYAQTTGDGINLTQVDVASATPAQLAHFSARSTIPLADLHGPSFDTVQRFDQPSLNDRQWGVSSDLSWELDGGFTTRLIDAYRNWRDVQTDGDVVFTPLDILNRHGAFESRSQSHELQLISPKDKLLGGRMDFVAGLYYFQEDYATGEVFDVGAQACQFVYGVLRPAFVGPCSTAPHIAATNGQFRQSADSEAAYLQTDFKITKTLELTLGARYTQDDKSGDFNQTVANRFFGAGVLRAPEATALSFKDSHPNWRANLSWHVTPTVMTFFTWSTGYKSGGFNNSGGAAALGQSRIFQSETSTDFELGIKSTFFARRLLLNADLFQTDLDNFQDRSFNGLTFVVRNAGSVRARGAEVEGQARLFDGFKLDYGVAYLDSVFTANHQAPGLPGCTGAANSCPLVQDLTGRPTNYAPKWTADLALEYDTGPIVDGWTVQARGSLNYGSKVFTTNDDNPQSLTGGNTLFGARVTAMSPDKRWSVAVYGENLTDVKYFTLKLPQTLDSLFGVRSAATGATLMRGFMGAPLTFGAKVTRSF